MKAQGHLAAREVVDSLAFEHSLWSRGYHLVAGIDEVGRGPWAGPVVAACVVLPKNCSIAKHCDTINGYDVSHFRDSKQLSAKLRRELAAEIMAMPGCHQGVGIVEVAEIDRLNILQASLLAMKLAVLALGKGDLNERCLRSPALGPPPFSSKPLTPDFLLVDGKFQIQLALPQQTLTKGDSHSASIAAASIVAKVRRDAIMEDYHRQYPQYDFDRHKGYGTAEHLRLLNKHGPCPIHRRSFKPVARRLEALA